MELAVEREANRARFRVPRGVMPSEPGMNPREPNGEELCPSLFTVQLENVGSYVDQASWLTPALSMHLRKCTIPSRIRSLAFKLLELVARPKGRSVTSIRIAGCGAGTGADMRAHARRSLASQDRTRLPPAHLGVAAPRGRTGLPARLGDLDQLHQPVAPPTTAANKTGPT